jgi:hypothetical protein
MNQPTVKQQTLRRTHTMNIESLVGRKVRYSREALREVIFIDRAVGITIQGYHGKTCINGPLSPNDTTANYDAVFDELIKQIDNWHIDLDKLCLVWTNGAEDFYTSHKTERNNGVVVCAVGG